MQVHEERWVERVEEIVRDTLFKVFLKFKVGVILTPSCGLQRGLDCRWHPKVVRKPSSCKGFVDNSTLVLKQRLGGERGVGVYLGCGLFNFVPHSTSIGPCPRHVLSISIPARANGNLTAWEKGCLHRGHFDLHGLDSELVIHGTHLSEHVCI